MSDYTAIQELLTRDIKLKTLELNNWLNLYFGNLFAKMRNKETRCLLFICTVFLATYSQRCETKKQRCETKKQDVYYSYVQFYNPSMLL